MRPQLPSSSEAYKFLSFQVHRRGLMTRCVSVQPHYFARIPRLRREHGLAIRYQLTLLHSSMIAFRTAFLSLPRRLSRCRRGRRFDRGREAGRPCLNRRCALVPTIT